MPLYSRRLSIYGQQETRSAKNGAASHLTVGRELKGPAVHRAVCLCLCQRSSCDNDDDNICTDSRRWAESSLREAKKIHSREKTMLQRSARHERCWRKKKKRAHSGLKRESSAKVCYFTPCNFLFSFISASDVISISLLFGHPSGIKARNCINAASSYIIFNLGVVWIDEA